MSSTPVTPLSPAAGSFVGTLAWPSASYALPKVSKKPQRFRVVNGSKLVPFPKSQVPYPMSYDKDILDCEALDHLFFKQLYRGISLYDWGNKQPSAVLDVGCGIGSWILDAARVWPSTNLLVGFDVVRIQPDLALIQDESLRLAERVRWVHGNFLQSLPFANEQFDYIRITRIAFALPENRWAVLLEEITRVLKTGGIIEVVEEDIIFPYQHPTSKMTSIREEGTPSRHGREGSGSSAAPSDSGEFWLSSARPSPSAPAGTSSAPGRVRSRSLGATSRTTLNTSSSDSSAGKLSSAVGSSFNLAKHSAVPQIEHIDKRKTVRDHFALQQAFNDMLDDRFINSRLTAQIPFYLSLHFQNVRAHAPLHFIAPPPRPSPAQTPLSRPGTAMSMHHKRSTSSLMSSRSQTHSRNPSAQFDLPKMELVRIESAPSDSNHSAEIFVTENTGIHLRRCLHYVLGCQEAIWESYHKLFPTSSRDQFDHLMHDFRNDMLGRTDAQTELFERLGSYLNSRQPSDEAVSASLYADYAPLLEDPSIPLPDLEKLEEEQRQQRQQTPPLICRTVRAFVCTKG